MSFQTFTFDSVVKDQTITAYLWTPPLGIEPRGVFFIAHGMNEYMGRYDEFATFLAQHGLIVVGKDHLGHGRSISDVRDLGYFGPASTDNPQLEDMHTLALRMRDEFPELPLFMMGHSMGSFLLREYITLYGLELDGAIIMSSGYMNGFEVSMARALVDLLTLVRGERYRSKFITKLMFGTYLKRIDNPRSPHDWLTHDTAVVDAYSKDPGTQFTFTLNGYKWLLTNIAHVTVAQAFTEVPARLPLLLISGSQDPLGHYGRDLGLLAERYRRGGSRDVATLAYADDRHEVLNELNRAVVYDDILGWVEGRLES